MFENFLRFFAALVLAALLSVPAHHSAIADTRALLIGVSNYDDSIGLADLQGPVNDVKLMRETLRGRGVEHIIVLADGIEGSAIPTREAILAGFDGLAADAQSGDLVIIHMSGHGTRQPDTGNDEADGHDEVFLPADAAKAAPGAQTIPNAIVDEEIGEAIAKIRQKGADVWFIMDSCHSGTGTRAGALNMRDRYVDPKVLGLSGSATPTGPVQGFDAQTSPPGDNVGGLVAFYAAQASEIAREVEFAGEAKSSTDNAWYGLFTAKLAARLSTAGAISYQQLFQSVLADMNDTSVPGGARLQTPFREGTMMNAPVLGGSALTGIRQYAVDDDVIAAGAVHGFVDGTVVALVTDAAAPAEKALGFAQMEEVGPLSSFLRPVSDDCQPDQNSLCATSGRIA